ncbi:MAG: hypothetical protein C5B51_16420 [Terriglobia bacterium]|nr:MAG: hypothetical protein C5B51_16420 [Terriglobia bacterium]
MQQGDSPKNHYRSWWCLIPLMAHGAYSQNLNPIRLVGSSLIIQVTADIAPRCGNAITAALSQNIASQLQQANISVAKVHNAELTTAVECAPAHAHNQRHETLQYCVSLAQVIAVPTAPRQHTLTTTWRQCGMTTCTKGTCNDLVSAEVHRLVTAFITEVKSPPRPPPTPRPADDATTAGDNISAKNPMARPMPLTRAGVVYLLYIITCLCVLLHWEYHRHQIRWKT